VTEEALRVIAASGAEASGWAEAICDRIDARSGVVREEALTAAGVDDMPGCSYRGLFRPDSETPTVVHIVRQDPADATMTRWQGSAWEVVPAELEPVGYDFVDLTSDRDLLAQALDAIGSGGSLVLRATRPRGYLQEPGIPLTLTAAADEVNDDEEQPPPLPPGAKVYAVVDDLDTSAVLDLFFVMAGPSVYRRSAAAWKPAEDLLPKLTSVDPPAIVAIEPEHLAAVVAQIDDYDQANPPKTEDAAMTAAGAWTEDLHPREAGKFAKKDGGKRASTDGGVAPSGNTRADAMGNYILRGGKRPAGVTAVEKKKKAAAKVKSKRSGGAGGGAGAPGSDPVTEAAQQALAKRQADTADSIDRARLDQAKGDFAEKQRRAKFDTGIGDQLVKLLNEGRDPTQVNMLLGLRMQAELGRRKKYDADSAENAEAFKIRSMEENLGLRAQSRKVSQLALSRRHARERTKLKLRSTVKASAGVPTMTRQQRLALLAAGANPPATSSMPNKLSSYWAHGKGAAKIRWGTGGDFNRCRKQLAKYLKPGQLAGACANLHKIATGTWPGKNAHGGKAKKALHAAGDRHPSGVMVALYPPPEVASRLALEGGEPPEDLHITLSYHGDVDELSDEEISSLHAAVANVAGRTAPIGGELGGYGRFLGSDEEGDPIWLALDAPGLSEARQDLVSELSDYGAEPRSDHGFTPHMTLAYAPKDGSGLDPVLDDPVLVDFGSLVVCVGPDQTTYPLGG
jgi:2'-5' RNA ligase